MALRLVQCCSTSDCSTIGARHGDTPPQASRMSWAHQMSAFSLHLKPVSSSGAAYANVPGRKHIEI